MVAIDMEKHKREQLRWLILITLNSARPLGANEDLVVSWTILKTATWLRSRIKTRLSGMQS